MKIIIHFLSISFFLLGYAQAQELQAIKKDYRTSISIGKAEIVSQSAERLNLSFTCKVAAGKKYLISGIALDKNKQPIEEVQAESQELAEGESIADLSFRFKQKNGKTYTTPKMETHFIHVFLNEKTKTNELLDRLNQSGNKNGSSSKSSLANALAVKYLYPIQKEWRVGGNASMTVKVNLEAIGKAKTLPRN